MVWGHTVGAIRFGVFVVVICCCVLSVFCLVFWRLVSCCGTPRSFYAFVRFVLGGLFIGFVLTCMLLLGLVPGWCSGFWGVLVVCFGVCGFGMVVLCFLLF